MSVQTLGVVMSVHQQSFPKEDVVLAKAFFNVGEQLGLKQQELAKVLGVDRAAISRLKTSLSLNPQSKKGEIALLLIRLARALFVITDGDTHWMRKFMHSHNKMTGGIPAEQISSIQGLMTVLRYVDVST